MEKILKDDKLYSLIEFREKIYEDLELSKSDLTTLLCAMLIASIGLNMNSIPIIIGAMLISPLMTPILGVGFALAILDTKLLKKSFKVLFIQVAVSLLASTLYFLLSPISYASTYLFSINCSFIMIATYIGTNVMMIKNPYFKHNREASKMRKILILVSLVLIIPSLASATTLVRDTLINESINNYLSDQFENHTILKKKYSKENNTLKLTISGKYLSESELQSIINKQNEYGLKNISIQVSQLTNDRLTEKELVDYIIQYKNDDDLQQIEKDKYKESSNNNK
ncbi:MAG: DUF389 domain-containing protein [Streptococcus lutetiensis]|nr:DUF389 domain-containing protein [Streptococcus lutetiensis]MBS5090415.1 DUF389 domain-containing protein [Streptococcus lutetiensis]